MRQPPKNAKHGAKKIKVATWISSSTQSKKKGIKIYEIKRNSKIIVKDATEKIDMDKNARKLIFVYNADSSVFSQVSDAIKKVVTPSKYECNLCMVTYGAISMKDEWKEFLDALLFEKEFLHRDEFQKQYPELKSTKLPAIFISQNNTLSVLVSADEINIQKNIDGLKNIINGKIKSI